MRGFADHIWKWFRREDPPAIIAYTLWAIFSLLSLIGIGVPGAISKLTLSGLILIGIWLIVASRKLADMMDRIARIPNGSFLKSLAQIDRDIDDDLTNAEEYWLVTPSGNKWFDRRGNVLRSKTGRTLVIDPRNGALQLVFQDIERHMMQNGTPLASFDRFRQERRKLMDELGVKPRIINHLLPWTALIINKPDRANCVVYVEIASYQNLERPWLRLRPGDAFFEWFIAEFEAMMQDSTPWQPNATDATTCTAPASTTSQELHAAP